MSELIQALMLIRSMSREELDRRLSLAKALFPLKLDRVQATLSLDVEGMKRYYLENIVYSQG